MAAAVLVSVLASGCAAGNVTVPDAVPPPVSSLTSPPVSEVVPGAAMPTGAPTPQPTGHTGAAEPGPPPKISTMRLTRALDRFLSGYGGRVAVAVRDLDTGRSYHYHRGLRLPTASTSKVGILMAMLLGTPWRRLNGRERVDAGRMIRFSDNAAADRMYERIGLESGLARANHRFGLRRTYTPSGRCVNLYCWGITQTTAQDQVRLIRALVRRSSPLAAEERGRVLRLMARVTPAQRWGISAAACENSRVSLKNGWLRHVANERWVVVSVGLIRDPGHRYAVAVLTEDGLTMGAGVARVEGAARRVLAAFRGGRGCAASGGQSVLSTSR